VQALSSNFVPDLPKEKLIVSIYDRILLIDDRDVNEKLIYIKKKISFDIFLFSTCVSNAIKE